jgi:polyhydroxyalkanoate synthesis regulator phasin
MPGGGGEVASGREQYLQALASLSDLTRTQAERVAGLLAKQGEVQSAQVGRVAEDLMRRTQKNREILSRLVQREVKRQLGLLGMATRDEVARLQQRVRALEQALERSSRASAAADTAPSRGRTTSSRTSPSGSGTTSTRTSRTSASASGRTASGSARSSTRASRAASVGSGPTKPSTRTRTGGASSRSTASSPRTRRPRDAGGSSPPDTPNEPPAGT